MNTPTEQIACSIVSRQLIADLSPTCRRPVANELPTSRNPFPISWQSIAHQSPTSRLLLGIIVADQSPIDLQPKNAIFHRTVVALFAVVFQSQGSRRQVAVNVWLGLKYASILVSYQSKSFVRANDVCYPGSQFATISHVNLTLYVMHSMRLHYIKQLILFRILTVDI